MTSGAAAARAATVARRRGGGLAVCALALAAAAAACRPSPRYAVERIAVAETDALVALEQAGVRRDAIVRAAARALETRREFLPASEARRAARRFSGQVVVHRADAVAGVGRPLAAHVLLTFQLSPVDDGVAMREVGRGTEPAPGGAAGVRDALERAVGSALDAAAGAFALELSSERKATPELVDDLSSGEARIRDSAVRALAERGDRSAVPALARLLRDPDPAVAERTVGALAQLRDERAVPPLIELARHRDAPFVANLARVVGDIGGADAQAWLVTLSSGHPDELVRAAARGALADLEARSPRASVH